MERNPVTAEDVVCLVQEAIRQDARFLTSSIEVTAKQGAVVLSGLVPDPATRAAAVAVAKRTRGVQRVVDQIRVQPFVPRFDADITADVVSAITVNANTNPAQIDVQTVDGVVYLHGTVPDPTIRQMVDSIARSIEGVRDVVDDLGIAVAVPHPDAEISQAIQERLRQTLRPEVADRIRVAVREGTVYLRGEVDTAAVRWAVEDLVRWIPGVLDVVDELHGPTAQKINRRRR